MKRSGQLDRRIHRTDPTNVRYVQLKSKHKKPYLRRHAASLFALAIIGGLLTNSLITHATRANNAVTEAQNFVSRMFSPEVSTTHSFASSYGFKMSYDSQIFYASAVDTASGDIFFAGDLATKRDYDTVRISPVSDDKNSSQNSLKLHIGGPLISSESTDNQLDRISYDSISASVNLTQTTITRLGSQPAKLDGNEFKLTHWQLQAKQSPASLIPVYITSYVGVVVGRPVTININSGSAPDTTLYNDVLESIQFSERTHAMAAPSPAVTEKSVASRSLLDNLMLIGLARAATARASISGSERTTSLYSPSVVKIYHAYCVDMTVATKLTFTGACNAISGSGFFVNSDGTIASNGHVVSQSPKDLIISEALAKLLEGDSSAFNFLAQQAGIKDSDFTGSMNKSEILDTAVDKMYAIPASAFKVTKQVSNLLVSLGSKTPDATELVKLTKNYQEYAEQETIKRAKQLAIDYRAIDGIKSFKASDVAIIKIGGKDYPSVSLGSIDNLIQGSDLIILGFPSNASDNGIVATDSSKVTLTAGKVSGIKNALGSVKKLIETDTTIGHGNSGGPALNSSGQVVGIATYTSDGSGKGNGTFNYVRDIADLKALAASSSIVLSASSTTQTEWIKGINAFYESHYSQAVTRFLHVKQLYFAHPKADEFIAAANDHIKNGDDIKDFPMPLVAGGLFIVLLGIGATFFFILRHRRLHGVYNAHVAAGTVDLTAVATSPATVSAIPMGEATYSALLAPSAAGSVPTVAKSTTAINSTMLPDAPPIAASQLAIPRTDVSPVPPPRRAP